jgi:hypothetical protein
MKGTEYLVSSYTIVVVTESYDVMANRKELIGMTISDAIDEVSHKPMAL